MSTILESCWHFKNWSASLGYFFLTKNREKRKQRSWGSEKGSTKKERGVEGKIQEGRERVEFLKPNINL